ncbi:hypothetical protein DFH09DRAFT_1282548 [Mycena vulgaris]|nr:hypothetical protein DFH09DRAFT_1282548 [Mycena vulgaris]
MTKIYQHNRREERAPLTNQEEPVSNPPSLNWRSVETLMAAPEKITADAPGPSNASDQPPVAQRWGNAEHAYQALRCLPRAAAGLPLRSPRRAPSLAGTRVKSVVRGIGCRPGRLIGTTLAVLFINQRFSDHSTGCFTRKKRKKKSKKESSGELQILFEQGFGQYKATICHGSFPQEWRNELSGNPGKTTRRRSKTSWLQCELRKNSESH